MRKMSLLLIIVCTMAFMGACEPKQLIYTFDFAESQNLGTEGNLWFATDPDKVSFNTNGVAINRSYLISPFCYKGDFLIEIEFFLYDVTAGKSEDILFELIDHLTGNGAGLLLEREGATGGEFSLRRYLPLTPVSEHDSLPESLVSDAVNVLEIRKTPGKVEFTLNDEPLGAVDGITDTAATHWLFKLYAYDGLNEGLTFHGFRKVSIRYGIGNQMPTP